MIDYSEFIRLCVEKHGRGWNSPAVKKGVVEDGFPFPWSMLPDEEKASIREEVNEFYRAQNINREKWMSQRNIPRKFWNMTPTKENEDCRKLIEQSMPLCLVSGKRKTSSVCWFMVERFDRECWSYISSVDLQQWHERDETKEDLHISEWAKTTKRLVIDDAGDEQAKFGNFIIPSIIMIRFDNDLETVVTTRLGPSDFAKYAPRIQTRVENRIVKIIHS